MENQAPQQPVAPQVLPKIPSLNPKMILPVVIGLVILAGAGAGYLLSGKRGGVNGVATVSGDVAPGGKKSLTEAGVSDETTFKDMAEGVLKEGGIDGEGTHYLERSGGKSQNVYLTSTVIDLSSFVDKKVQVWGQTLSGKKAGWLMDVGKIKVIQ